VRLGVPPPLLGFCANQSQHSAVTTPTVTSFPACRVVRSIWRVGWSSMMFCSEEARLPLKLPGNHSFSDQTLMVCSDSGPRMRCLEALDPLLVAVAATATAAAAAL
jgi:hypothetical protein